MFDFYIGNKNYLLWLLCFWLLMKYFGVFFIEYVVFVVGWDYNLVFKLLVGNVCVFSLYEDGFQVWESIVIVEFLVECYLVMWLVDEKVWVWVCSILVEMYVGFVKLWMVMLMNFKFKLKGKLVVFEVQCDIDWVIEIWEEV